MCGRGWGVGGWKEEDESPGMHWKWHVRGFVCAGAMGRDGKESRLLLWDYKARAPKKIYTGHKNTSRLLQVPPPPPPTHTHAQTHTTLTCHR